MNEITSKTIQEIPESQEERVIALLNDIDDQVRLQEAAIQFFELMYNLAFLDEGNAITSAKDAIYSMYVRAANCRASISNAAYELRKTILPQRTSKQEKIMQYKPIELIDENI